jgi:hypothetical protein
VSVHNKIQSVLGVDVRARHIEKETAQLDPFINPLIHKQINGNDIVPLNITKLWGK